jgi:hypothetical protein
MTVRTRVVAACNTCEVIGPVAQTGASLSLRGEAGRPKRPAIEARADWARFLDDHATHDVRLIPANYDPDIPLPGWMPRPFHGPPDSGRREHQVVACPDCRGIWRPTPTERGVAAAGAAGLPTGMSAHTNPGQDWALDVMLGGMAPGQRSPLVVFKTVDQGADWFWFCTGCRNVFGSAAEKAVIRAELGDTAPADALWPLQRQGMDRTPPARTGRRG